MTCAGKIPALVPTSELTVEFHRRAEDLYFNTPVAIAHAVVPPMLDRGDGSLLDAFGASTINPGVAPGISGFNSVGAGTRHWLRGMHSEFGPNGVFVGMLGIGAMIEGSTAYESTKAAPSSFGEVPVGHPSVLAETYRDMYTARDRAESVYPARAADVEDG
ncbi:hypothetical protein [Microbacterium sp. NPDC089696]|uniref:hypothetical protein n=1 Tax=Microbacterium sp. NPDC089696 TaxID=3364199 RepID=UPI003809E6DA